MDNLDSLDKRTSLLSLERRRLLEALLKQKHRQHNFSDAISPRPKGLSAVPLSYAQQRLWIIDQLNPGSAAYNIFSALRLTGPLDIPTLQRSLHSLVERHEALRTSFMEDTGGSPSQIIRSEVLLDCPLLDVSSLPENVRPTVIKAMVNSEVSNPFDLANDPLIRVRLLRLTSEEHVILLTLHHIVSDGWSMNILLREVAMLYQSFINHQPSALPPLPIQYADFACWQRESLLGDTLEKQIEYWRKQLDGVPNILRLPTDRPRPTTQSQHGASFNLHVNARISKQLIELGHAHGATLFMTLLSALNVLLYRYTTQHDICIGSPIANRTHPDTHGLIGFFANTLPLRNHLSGDQTFSNLLNQVRKTTLAAYTHQDLPFEQLLDELKIERDTSYTSLFQVMLVLQNTPATDVHIDALKLERIASEHRTSKFDLTVGFSESTDGLNGTFEYNTDLFEHATIKRLANSFSRVLEQIAMQPETRISEFKPLDDFDQQRLKKWNATASSYAVEDKSVHKLFELQAIKTPESTAVVFENQQLKYKELNDRANQLAHYLV